MMYCSLFTAASSLPTTVPVVIRGSVGGVGGGGRSQTRMKAE
jgi:hypothetical protein